MTLQDVFFFLPPYGDLWTAQASKGWKKNAGFIQTQRTTEVNVHLDCRPKEGHGKRLSLAQANRIVRLLERESGWKHTLERGEKASNTYEVMLHIKLKGSISCKIKLVYFLSVFNVNSSLKEFPKWYLTYSPISEYYSKNLPVAAFWWLYYMSLKSLTSG